MTSDKNERIAVRVSAAGIVCLVFVTPVVSAACDLPKAATLTMSAIFTAVTVAPPIYYLFIRPWQEGDERMPQGGDAHESESADELEKQAQWYRDGSEIKERLLKKARNARRAEADKNE